MKNLIKIFLSKLGYKLNKVKSTENHLTYLKSNFNIKTIYMEIIIGDTYVGQKSLSYYLNKMESYEFKLQGFYDLTFNTKSDLIQLDALFIHKNFINKI